MLATAYAQYRNALFTSIAMFIMVLISGLVAFGFWEPIANLLDLAFQDKPLAGCEDMITLVLLFALSLFLLRLANTYIAPDMIEEHGKLQYIRRRRRGPGYRLLCRGFSDLHDADIAR